MFSDRFLKYDKDRDLQSSQTKTESKSVDSEFIPPS